MSSGTQNGERVSCWCGNNSLEEFSSDYLRCSCCETLVLAKFPDPKTLLLADDEHGFYGRQYYESYVTQELGLPSITERAKTDLEDRCPHWLRTLIKYKLPPSRIIEIGSAHGGFVALMRWAGYEATGLELSQELVDLARRTFEAPTLLGTIEQQSLEPQSLDVIVLMDVLEHLPDPAGTIQHCLRLLKSDGLIIIQCPEYTEGKTFAEMQLENAQFLQHMHGPDHLYLFSKKSVRALLNSYGVRYINFERAVFSAYDMFMVASREPLSIFSWQEIQSALATTASSRLILALLGLHERLT